MVRGSPDAVMKQILANSCEAPGLPSGPDRRGGDSGILPLDVIHPEPRRLCHVSAG